MGILCQSVFLCF